MKQAEFLKQLEINLMNIPQNERKDILSDYREHFEAGLTSGRNEEELAEALGSPKSLGKQLTANYHIEKADKAISAQEIFRAVLAAAGLGFFNLAFVAFPFFGAIFFLAFMVIGGIGALITSIIGFLASFFAIIVPSFVYHFANFSIRPVAGLFVFILLAAFSILFLIGCGYLCKWFYQLTVSYLKINVKIIKGDKSTDN